MDIGGKPIGVTRSEDVEVAKVEASMAEEADALVQAGAESAADLTSKDTSSIGCMGRRRSAEGGRSRSSRHCM